jgi:hypothetical protein
VSDELVVGSLLHLADHLLLGCPAAVATGGGAEPSLAASRRACKIGIIRPLEESFPSVLLRAAPSRFLPPSTLATFEWIPGTVHGSGSLLYGSGSFLYGSGSLLYESDTLKSATLKSATLKSATLKSATLKSDTLKSDALKSAEGARWPKATSPPQELERSRPLGRVPF